MIRYPRFARCLIAFLWIAAVLFGYLRFAAAQIPPNLHERIDKFVAEQFKEGGPGAAVLVVHKGTVVHRRGYGLANIEKEIPISHNTAFDLASVSKQFTAMAIMILAERGRLGYDNKVADLLPNYKVAVHGRPVIVQDLLWQTSGLADYTGNEWQGTDKEFEMLSTADHVKWISGTQARRAPGIQYEYNNSGYALLAQIVQRVSRTSFAEFLHANIFDPLKMTETAVVDDLKTKVPNAALGYKVAKKSGKVSRSVSPSIINGDGNIFSTIDDLAKWDAALRENKLVKKATLMQAFAPGKLDNGKQLKYGFGWETMRYPDGTLCVWHTGGWVGTATYIARWIDQEFSVVVLSNDEQADVGKLGDKIGELFDE